NNDTITNPHLIRPRNRIAFMPGSGTELPEVQMTANDGSSPGTSELEEVETRSGDTANPDEAAPSAEQGTSYEDDYLPPPAKRKHRSQEWKKLPLQPWEQFQVRLPPQVDPLGFDSRSRIRFKSRVGLEPTLIPSMKETQPVGQI